MNEVYLNMYRVAVQSGRLSIEFVPEPYRTELITEMNSQEDEDAEVGE